MMYVIVQLILSFFLSSGLSLQNQYPKAVPYDPILKQSAFVSDNLYVCELDYEIFVTKELFLGHLEREHTYFYEGFMSLTPDAREAYVAKQKIKPNP